MKCNTCLIITNYNGLQYLSVYLESIAVACAAHSIPLIVTDNGSTDGSLEYLQKGNYLYTINPLQKQGYASNLNNGIRYARSLGKFDYFILSNNDIEVNGKMFGQLGEVLEILTEKDPLTGLVGFDEVLPARKDYFREFNYEAYDPAVVAPAKKMIGFFFFALSAKLLDAVGFFDEAYFIYGEDNDYDTRARKSGYTSYNTFLPVMHYSEGSSRNPKLTSWYVYRNAFLYAQKNLSLAGNIKMLFSFINQIYNPFHRSKDPSNDRVRRNGFLYNNYLLVKSLIWNLGYFLKKKRN